MASQANVALNMKPFHVHVVRGIFRALKTPLLSEDLLKKSTSAQRSNKLRSNESTAYLIRQYRMAATLTSDREKEKLRKMAMDFFQLRLDIAARGDLYALDAGADQVLTPHETSRRAAARAGLQLPELYKDCVSGMDRSK
jgi:hypothetical protein